MDRGFGIRILYVSILAMAIVLSSIILSMSIGLYDAIIWVGGGSSGNIIIGVGSRTLYSSRVPVELYRNMLHDPSIADVYPVVASICILNGKPVIVKGMEYQDIEDIYIKYLVSGNVLKGSSAIIGYGLASKYNISVGDPIYLSSINTMDTVILKVSGIYKSGGFADYEIVTTVDNARLLAGLGRSYYSYILYKGRDLSSVINSIYTLDIDLGSNLSGYIKIYDVDSELVKELKLDNGKVSTKLPYGYYIIYYVSKQLSIEILDVFLDTNKVIHPEFKGLVELKIYPPTSGYSIALYNSSGEVNPSHVDRYFSYLLKPGIYRLILNGSTYDVVIIKDSIIDLRVSPPKPKYLLTINVSDESGKPVKDYYVTISDLEGRIIYTGYSSSSRSTYMLDKGSYIVTISTGYIYSRKKFSIDRDLSLSIKIPIHPTKVGERLLRSVSNVKSLKGIDVVNLSIESYIGLTISLYMILPLVLIILSIIISIYIHKIYLASIERTIKTLIYMNYRMWDILVQIILRGLPYIISSIIIGYPIYLLLGSSLSNVITLFSYGIQCVNNYVYLSISVFNILLLILESIRYVRILSMD